MVDNSKEDQMDWEYSTKKHKKKIYNIFVVSPEGEETENLK